MLQNAQGIIQHFKRHMEKAEKSIREKIEGFGEPVFVKSLEGKAKEQDKFNWNNRVIYL